MTSSIHANYNVSRNDLPASVQQPFAFSEQITVQESGDDFSAGIATSQLKLHDSHGDEKSVDMLALEHETYLRPSRSSSTIPRFMGRLRVGASVRSLSTLGTIPSWRSGPLPNAHNPYSKMDARDDGEGSGSWTDAPDHGPSHPPGTASSRHSCYRSFRRRRYDKSITRSQIDGSQASVPLWDLFSRFSRSTTATNRHHDPTSCCRSRSSLDTEQSSFTLSTSTSVESYPSPFSADAVAVFQGLLDNEAPSFDGSVKHHHILEDQVLVIFAEAIEGSSTSTDGISVHAVPKRRGLLVLLRRRVNAMTNCVVLALRKFRTVLHKARLSPSCVDDDDHSVQYDIPCLAYITCLW
ncbi:hypothetical protein F5148DRAFT_1150169 [Russula earlei]|uniref:Uncharacterized protein n=1 Tax=Russula earlei TaxID=71964 RepID=A0ACC0U5H8_9AGAM|nr:hypothetical protein F5148DRAFT_1150169 [Russula earlei]